MRKWLKRLGIALLAVAIVTALLLYRQFRDRFPGYEVDLHIQAADPQPLHAGFAARPITPQVPDPWTDANGDARYDPGEGDTYGDGEAPYVKINSVGPETGPMLYEAMVEVIQDLQPVDTGQ